MSRRAAKTMGRRSGSAGAAPLAPEDRYINREQLRAVIPASDMTIWRWQRDSEIAFPVPVKLRDNGRNYWWLPDVRAWMRRREERQPQAVRHLVIRGNGGESKNTDLPAAPLHRLRPPSKKPQPIGAATAGRPGIGRKRGPPIDTPRTVAEQYPAAPAAVKKSRRPQRVDQTVPCPERPPRIGDHSGRPMTRKLEGALGRPDDDCVPPA
jgi:predicted DNA-binding transcriptional regulator AlpA